MRKLVLFILLFTSSSLLSQTLFPNNIDSSENPTEETHTTQMWEQTNVSVGPNTPFPLFPPCRDIDSIFNEDVNCSIIVLYLGGLYFKGWSFEYPPYCQPDEPFDYEESGDDYVVELNEFVEDPTCPVPMLATKALDVLRKRLGTALVPPIDPSEYQRTID